MGKGQLHQFPAKAYHSHIVYFLWASVCKRGSYFSCLIRLFEGYMMDKVFIGTLLSLQKTFQKDELLIPLSKAVEVDRATDLPCRS